VPPIAFERGPVQKIGREFEILGDRLRNYPMGDGASRGARTAAPARRILASLKKVNATVRDGARKEHLSPAAFRSLGREFDKIGATLQAVGSAATKTTKRSTRKRTRR